LLHLPAGRAAALAYLNQLRSFEHFWIYQTNTSPFAATNSPSEILAVNPNLPQFPAGTEWALVRRMLVIDASGNLQLTPLIESLQLRHYLSSDPAKLVVTTNRNGLEDAQFIPPQKFYEFQMNRRQNGELRATATGEKDFLNVHFFSQGIDPFEWKSDPTNVPDSTTFKSPVLADCRICHNAQGIYSVNTYAGLFAPHLTELPQLFNAEVKLEVDAAIDWKREQYNWGLLQGLWDPAN
jgi:hypothetical protein